MDTTTNKPVRAIHEFTIPASKRAGDWAGRKVGIRELTAREERIAGKMATKEDPIGALYEMTLASICEIDGKPVTHGDASLLTIWESMPPAVRQLLCNAYGRVHNADDDMGKDFFGSEVTTVR